MAEPVGRGSARVAHRVQRHVLRHLGRGCGHQRRRHRPQLPAPREPARAVRGALRHQAVGQLLRPHRPPPHRRAEDVKVTQELHHHPRRVEDVHREADQVPVPPAPVVRPHGPHARAGGRRRHRLPADGSGGHRREDVCRIFSLRQGCASRARMRRGVQRAPGAHVERRGARVVRVHRQRPRGSTRRHARQHQHPGRHQIAQGTHRRGEQVPRRRRCSRDSPFTFRVRGKVRDDDPGVPGRRGDHRGDRLGRHRRRRRGRRRQQGGGHGARAGSHRQVPRRDSRAGEGGRGYQGAHAGVRRGPRRRFARAGRQAGRQGRRGAVEAVQPRGVAARGGSGGGGQG